MLTDPQKRPECGMCTLKCVTLAYRRAPWFRLVREPMLIGMRFLVAVHRLRPEVRDYPFPTAACRGCIRFCKTLLFRRSGTFRWLHGHLNPVFNYFMDRLVTPEERRQARDYALRASAGTLDGQETAGWMEGMKRGL